MALDLPSYMLGKAKGGGGGGTSNYNELSNKPSINGTTLSGDKTSSDLGLSDIIQYSTMPIASADTVGKIVQYTGATISGSYTNGYFYIGIDNSGSYSWENLNVQASSGGSTPIIITADNRSSADTVTAVNAEFQKFKNGEEYCVYAYTSSQWNPVTLFRMYFANMGGSDSSYNSQWVLQSPLLISGITETTGVKSVRTSVQLTISSGQITALGSPSITQENFAPSNTDGWYLKTRNSASYTPTGNYNPATKKYVDDKPTTYAGYDATKTQVLKNVKGTLTWVDE